MDVLRYLDLFLAESREHLGAAYQLRTRLQDEPDDGELWREMLRHAHSLKGMAATMGYRSMVALAHAVEDLLERLPGTGAAETTEHLPLLGESLACLGQIVDRVERGDDPTSPQAEALAQTLRERFDLAEAPDPFVGAHAVVAPTPVGDACLEAPPPIADSPQVERSWKLDLTLAPELARSAQITVRTLGRVAELGRVVQAHPPLLTLRTARFEGRLRLVLSTTRELAELEARLRAMDSVRSFRIEPEAPTVRSGPSATGSGPWVRVRADLLDSLVERVLELELELARLRARLPDPTSEVRQPLERSEFLLKETYATLMELRLVPFQTVAQRLNQTVHELSRELGKEVQLDMEGGDVQLDRLVLDALLDPLLHMVRNAMDHGIESPTERRASGKPERGRVSLRLTRGGDRIHVGVADDGRGIDVEALKRKALQLGLIGDCEAERMSDEDALVLTTLPGLSTADRISHVSGRGVGLDVVRDRIEQLGGILEISSGLGSGTELRLSVPLRLALVQTLLVRCAGELYAVPISAVRRTLRVEGTRYDSRGEKEFMEFDGGRLQLVRLDRRLGLTQGRPEGPPRPARALIVGKPGEAPVGLVVDEVLGRRDVVVRPFSGPLTQLRSYSGAALLEDGAIALVLDPLHLIGA